MKATEKLNALKQLRTQLQLQINALDSAIEMFSQLADDRDDDFVATSPQRQEPINEFETPYKGKAKNTKFESAIDITQFNVPEGPWTCKCGTLNPAGTTTCMECKKKRPKGIRTE